MQVSVSRSPRSSWFYCFPRWLGRRRHKAAFQALPLLIFLLIAAWTLRLYHLDTMSLWWDESLSWDRATNTLPAILSNTIQIQNIATRDLHPPFYFVLLHFVVQLAGTTEFALRFLSVAVNVLTLALFVPLARLLFRKRSNAIGLLAVGFATVSPFYVWYSQEARPYALVLLTSTFTVYALLRWLKTNPHTWRDLVSRRFVLFAAGFALSFATLYLSFVLLPFFAATILIFPELRRTRLRMGLAAALAALFGVILFLMPRETDITSWEQAGPTFVPLFIMLRDVWNSFNIGLSMTLDQATLLDWFALALWLVGIFSLLRVRTRDARLGIFLFSYLLIPALALHLGSFLRPLYLNSRHLITASPAFYIGLAVGASAIARRLTNDSRRTNILRLPSFVVRTATVIILALPILYFAFVSLNNLYFNETFAKDDHKAWARFLRERMRPDDYVMLVAPQAEKIVEYYLPQGVQWESLPHLGQTRDWQEFLDREAILNAYRNHPRVWLLELHQPVADPTLHITDLLKRWGYATDTISFRGISTEIRLQSFVYERTPQEPQTRTPENDRIFFSHNFELVGFETPRETAAGARGVVNLYWRMRRQYSEPLNVSLRVVDAKGAVWGQWDAPPIGSLYPLSKWQVNRIYLDQHDLIVDAGAPPGRYFIEIGVYNSSTNESWLAYRGETKSDKPIRLAEITVTRPDPPRDPTTLVMDAHTNISFGDALDFVGYDLESGNTNPGSEISLTLYFQVERTRAGNVQGRVEIAAPWWQFWNRVESSAPFALDLTDRQAGDIVQTRVNVRVPGEASAGAFDLRLASNELQPSSSVFGTIHVDSLARSLDLPPIAHPMNARFGDTIQFLGYDLAAPQPLKPNDRVHLTLYWRSLKPMASSYTVFAHLIDDANKIYGQRDQLPLGGARPTTSWAVGEVFSDVYEFDVAGTAPPGAYKIEIGFYNASDFTRLPAYDANGNALGDHILFEDLRVQ